MPVSVGDVNADLSGVSKAIRVRVPVIGAPIDALGWDSAIGNIRRWALARESRYVCICNVHSVVTASRDAVFAEALAQADMNTSDGAPVAWMMRRLGHAGQQRINGPELMWRYCQKIAGSGEGVYLYGSSPDTLVLLEQRLLLAFPGLLISGRHSPPFRPLTAEELQQDIDRINESGAGVVWVSLGCPKQELWMARHAGRINAVMVGVGAAFDFHAGKIGRAPDWMQNNGLEWLHRLASEPRRLWRRYLVSNSLFVVLATQQLVNHWLRGSPRLG